MHVQSLCFLPGSPSDPMPCQQMPCGLINQGQTCFANAVIVLLNSVKAFRDAVRAHPRETAIDYQLNALMNALDAPASESPGGVKAESFTMLVRDPDDRFIGAKTRQHDAHEFFWGLCGQLGAQTDLRNSMRMHTQEKVCVAI